MNLTTTSTAARAQCSFDVPISPNNKIDVTATETNVAAYDVFKAFEEMGEIDNVERTGAENFTITFAGGVERDEVGAVYSAVFAVPPDQQSPDNILHALNDDCLMDLFELMDTRQLYEMAWVCERFRSIAVRVFQAKYRKEPFDWNDLHKCSPSSKLSLFVDCMRIFHPTIISGDQQLCSIKDRNIIYRAIAEYCPNLKELQFYSNPLEPQTITALQPLMPKLRKLETMSTDILRSSGSSSGDVDWQLEELHISLTGNWSMPNVEMPKLTEVVVRKSDQFNSSKRMTQLFEFIARNGQIKKITFINCPFNRTEFRILAESVPNIEQLKFVGCSFDNSDHSDTSGGVQMLRPFKYLTSCEISLCTSDIFMDLIQGAPLEAFKFYGYKAVPIDAICRFTTITSLSLSTYKLEWIEYAEVRRLMLSNMNLQELNINKTNFTLADIKRILTKSNITKLDVGLTSDVLNVNQQSAALNELSTIIARRPDLRVQIRVCCKDLMGSLRQHSEGLSFTYEKRQRYFADAE